MTLRSDRSVPDLRVGARSVVPGRAFVAEKRLGAEDFWLLWWYPRGCTAGQVFQIRNWPDIDRVVTEIGIRPDQLQWNGCSLTELTQSLGPRTRTRSAIRPG